MVLPAPHPRHGPRVPAVRTRTRAPGSVRRTTHTDIVRPDAMGGDLLLSGAGRDTTTSPNGAVVTAGAARLSVRVNFAGGREIRAIKSDPDRPGLRSLVGAVAGSGFRRRAAEAVPGDAEAGTVLYQLLDDVPVTCLIAGYAVGASSAAGRHAGGGTRGTGPRAGICAGFQAGGTMMLEIARYGSSPVSVGPVAPEIDADDPDGWHGMPELPPLGMRRRRLLDVIPGPGPIADWQVMAWFRDTYRAVTGEETVVHEYRVRARVTPGTWRITAIEADPLVLPWTECPQAAPSARRLIGAALEDLRADVSATFTGTSTCTHLNDQLRSLADVLVLARATARAGAGY
jgi:DUF2889 family protein